MTHYYSCSKECDFLVRIGIITFDQKDKFGNIEVIPFWEWVMKEN
jgi:hypothetical protein